MAKTGGTDGRGLDRRRVLELGAATGAALAAQAIVSRRALSSSAALNLYTWSDCVHPEMVESFTEQTGIELNLATYGSNDEVSNKLRASGGKGLDLVMPSVTYTPARLAQGLLRPLDGSEIEVSGVIPSM